jgi:prostatic aicd phosphatase
VLSHLLTRVSSVRADAGGEGGVIYNSAVSLVQGLYPANSNYTTRLANGTTIEGPLDGYQVRMH